MSLLCALWVAKDSKIYVNREDTDHDQTLQICRLIWVFTLPTSFLRFLCAQACIFYFLFLLFGCKILVSLKRRFKHSTHQAMAYDHRDFVAELWRDASHVSDYWWLAELVLQHAYWIYPLEKHQTDLNNFSKGSQYEPIYAIYANNKGTDQPAHPRSLISAFVICSLDSIILKLPCPVREGHYTYWHAMTSRGFGYWWLAEPVLQYGYWIYPLEKYDTE